MTIHVVKPGDSVYSIAQQYDVPMRRIIEDNDLKEPTRLTPGQTLIIQYPKRVYTVREGDTLGTIAAKLGTTVYQLWQNNPQLAGKDQIYPGQQLVVDFEGPKKGALAVNAYAYPGIDLDVLRQTLPYLTYLSVFSFGAQPDGSLTYIDDRNLPQLARQYGAIPLMVLTTLSEDGTFSGERASELLNNPGAQETLAQNLIDYMKRNGYGGVNVDFEYIPPEDRDRYTQFIEMLKRRLNEQGFLVVTSLAPKTSADQPGLLYEAHDYPGLGDASNAVNLMTYEWGYSRSAPMAIAPLDKVSDVVSYATSVIPDDKILMGMPNYAYNWTLPHVPGVSVARSLGSVEAVDEAIDKRAAIDYDYTAQSPHYEYYQNGTKHEVWFEDARSVLAKLALAREYGLQGVSIWNAMRYFPQLWTVLNNQYAIKKEV